MLSVAIIFKVILHPFLSSEKDITKEDILKNVGNRTIFELVDFSQNIFFHVPEKKKNHTVVQQHEPE